MGREGWIALFQWALGWTEPTRWAAAVVMIMILWACYLAATRGHALGARSLARRALASLVLHMEHWALPDSEWSELATAIFQNYDEPAGTLNAAAAEATAEQLK